MNKANTMNDELFAKMTEEQTNVNLTPAELGCIKWMKTKMGFKAVNLNAPDCNASFYSETHKVYVVFYEEAAGEKAHVYCAASCDDDGQIKGGYGVYEAKLSDVIIDTYLLGAFKNALAKLIS